jgi:AcrR family transcriptional regulator
MASTRRDEIAEGFKRRFEHFGFKKTSVDDVARDLRISKKTIYEHFNTKEEIFYYVVFRVATRLRDGMAVELEGFDTNREKVHALIRMIFEQSRKWLKSGNNAFEFRYKYRISELAFKDAYADLVRELLENGMAEGEFSGGSPQMTLLFIQGIIKEAMDMVVADPDVELEQEVIRAVDKLLG